MSETDGKLWPGWETVRLIGRGSFGAVYEIQRTVFDDVEKAALKVISIPQNDSDIEELYSDGYDDESITSTFESHLKSIVAEYTLTRKMNDCVNIVSCDDVRYIQHDNGIGWVIFIKMELLTPLTKSLPSAVEENAVIKLGLDLCNALAMCRKHGIVHRDIKPQNIFVSSAGDYKLGDFGVAKTIEKTTGGTKIGTYKYMAPEVYNNQPYGGAADMYSLGLVLYWLLNERRMPFMPLPPEKLKAGTEEAARRRRMSGERLPAPANGSEDLKQIVLKACAYNPQDRYQTPEQMRRDLLVVEHAWRMQHPDLSGLQVCPACGFAVEMECRFCTRCGTRLVEIAEEQQEKTEHNLQDPQLELMQIQPPACEIVMASLDEDPEADALVQTVLPTRTSEQKFVQDEEMWEIEISAEEIEACEQQMLLTEAEDMETPMVELKPTCPHCGNEVPSDTKFCIHCGARLTVEHEEKPKEQLEQGRRCPGCGVPLIHGTKFCIQCGCPLEQPNSALSCGEKA